MMKITFPKTSILFVFALFLLAASSLFAVSSYNLLWVEPPSAITESLDVRIDFMVNPIESTQTESLTILYGTQNGGADPSNYPYKVTQIFTFYRDLSHADAVFPETTYTSPSRDTIQSIVDKAVFGSDTVLVSDFPVILRDSSNYFGRQKTVQPMYAAPLAGTVQRSLYFSPRFQTNSSGVLNMKSGRFYFIIANQALTKVSNEGQFIVESFTAPVMKTPKGDITEQLPLFTWTPVPGVPYYHLLLSSQPIEISGEGINNAKFIWQAITPGSSIRYGVPDPSGIFPPPPPLSTGQQYQWVMLNNYGNSKEYTSVTAYNTALEFTITGSLGGLTAPDTSTMKAYGLNAVGGSHYLPCSYLDDDLASTDTTDTFSDSIRFTWGSCTDPSFNLYKIYLYVHDSTDKFQAAISVWNRSTLDTFVTLKAKSFLLNNRLYEWEIFAENVQGAGIVSQKRAFYYRDNSVQYGNLHIQSREIIGSSEIGVKFVTTRIEALTGSTLPIDLVTNNEGNSNQQVEYGTYRITLSNSEFEEITKDTTVDSTNDDVYTTFYLQRKPGSIFGTIEDTLTNARLADVKIQAISEYNDTLCDTTDANGSFSLAVTVGDWNVTAEKAGYRRSLEKKAVVEAGQNLNLGLIRLKQFDNILSGTITNSITGKPVLNAEVVLSRNSVFIQRKYSDNNGNFAFNVEQGTGYHLDIIREGFAAALADNFSISGNLVYNFTLEAQVGIISGITDVAVWSQSRDTLQVNGRKSISVIAVNQSGDTVAATQSNRDFFYTLSLPLDTYTVWFMGTGLQATSFFDTVRTPSEETRNVILKEYGAISGTVNALLNSTRQRVDVVATGHGQTWVVKSDAVTGGYAFTGLDTGVYHLTFSCPGFAVDSLSDTLRDTLYHSQRYFKSLVNTTMTLVEGTKTRLFALKLLGVRLNSSTDSSVVKVKSPFRRNLSYRDSLTGVSAGVYVVGTDVSADSLIDIDSARISIGNADPNRSTVVLGLPLKHSAPAQIDTSLGGDTVELRLIVDSVGLSALDVDSASARIYFRGQSQNTFASAPLYRRNSDTLIFRFEPTVDNTYMKYYFVAYIGNTRYSNVNALFTTFVPPSLNIRYITLTPTALSVRSPAVLPWNTTVNFRIILKNGLFTEFDAQELSDLGVHVSWTATSRTGLTFADTGTPVMKLTISKNNAINISKVDTVRVRIRSTVTGLDTLLSTYFSVRKLTVDTLLLLGDKTEIYSGEKVSFALSAMNLDSNQQFSTSGLWSVSSAALQDSMDQTGQFRSPMHYVGTVTINATTLGKRAFIRLPIKHLALAAESTWASNQEDFAIRVGSGVFTGAQEFYMDRTDKAALPVLKAVTAEGQVISPIYHLRTGTPAAASDSFSLCFAIPQGNEDANLLLGRWNQRLTRWEIQSGVSIGDNSIGLARLRKNNATTLYSDQAVVFKTLKLGGTGDVGGVSQYAVLSASRQFGIYSLKVGPNPFSPFVTSRDNDGKKWKGVRVEFEVGSQNSPDVHAAVDVLNLEGNLVRKGLTLQEADPTGSGFSRISDYGIISKKRVAIWDGLNDWGRLCRNGRYLLRILVDDGVDKTYKTIPIVLFK